MAKIRTMAAFMKVNPHLRFGDETSPVDSPDERAMAALQKMVREVNLKHPPLTVERFLDLSHYIGDMLRAEAITKPLAREFVGILTLEWERALYMEKNRTAVRNTTEARRGRT